MDWRQMNIKATHRSWAPATREKVGGASFKTSKDGANCQKGEKCTPGNGEVGRGGGGSGPVLPRYRRCLDRALVEEKGRG